MSRSTREAVGTRNYGAPANLFGARTVPEAARFGAVSELFTDWDCGTAVMEPVAVDAIPTDTPIKPPHDLERSVCRALRRQSKLRFSSLVVRRTRDGVLLEGVMEQDAGAPNVAEILRAIGVVSVDNRLVVR